MSHDRPQEPSVSPSSSDTPSSRVDDLLRRDAGTLDQVPVDELFGRVAQQTVDHTPTWRDRLRELATPARVGIVLVGLVGGAAAMLSLFGMRSDLDGVGLAWLAGVHALVLLASIVGLAFSLRPTHRPPVPVLAWLAVVLTLALPFVLSLVPGLVPGMSGSVPALAHLMCGSGGLLVALPTTVLVLLLDRGSQPASWRVLLAAGASGLSAFGFGWWHCPSVDPMHLIGAHASLGVGLGLVTLGAVRLMGWVRGRG